MDTKYQIIPDPVRWRTMIYFRLKGATTAPSLTGLLTLAILAAIPAIASAQSTQPDGDDDASETGQPAPALAAQPGDLPAWLRLSGAIRSRVETLDGQYRSIARGGDLVFATRALLRAEARFQSLDLVFELQDSRIYLDDAGTPLSTSLVNPLDLLQAHARFRFGSLFGAPIDSEVRLGRFTLDVRSRRFIERNNFRNTINSYTGVYWNAASTGRWGLHAFYIVPVGKRPTDRQALADNELDGVVEQWSRRFWAVHYVRQDLLPDAAVEVFLYGLNEGDSESVATANRRYFSPGFRLYREPIVSRADFDLEFAYRWGHRRATSSPADTRDLDVRAHMLHAAIGYSFDHPWRIRVGVDYDRASGDSNPNDLTYGRYDRLFGTRRKDFGNTGIHGPLTRSNISAPGARIELRPTSRMDARVTYKAAFLASATDAWTRARRRDPTGSSGAFIGHSVDARMRYWIIPDRLRGEIGGSLLLAGRFAREAPDGDGEDTRYGYLQFTTLF